MSKKTKKNFTQHLEEEIREEETAEQRTTSIANIKSEIANAHAKQDAKIFFALAERCFELGLAEEHYNLVLSAARLGHKDAAFLFASMEVTSKKPCDFLQEHCKLVDADPRCLTLLAQTMESQECGLEFNLQTCFQLENRAILQALNLMRQANNRTWRHALFTASCERARLILDHNLEATDTNPSWMVAKITLAQFFPIESAVKYYGLKNLEKMDLHILLGRIADKARVFDDALSHYRAALAIAQRMGEPLFFLRARIATITPDEQEATQLLPNAIAWLDDLGIGKNDEEMPDLVARFSLLMPREAAERRVKLTSNVPQFSLPPMFSLLGDSAPTLTTLSSESISLFPPLTAASISIPALSSGVHKRPCDDSFLPLAKHPNIYDASLYASFANSN